MDIQALEKICKVDDEWFLTNGSDKRLSYSNDGILVHHINGGKILGVAYIGDKEDSMEFFAHDEKSGRTWASSLRQRLGAHILLNEIPAMGITIDVLIAGDDVNGVPLAEMFFTPDEYSWIFSFDLPGSGVCMYQYEDTDVLAKLLEYGFVGKDDGSYAAIDDLWFLGYTGFNFGNGLLGEGKFAQGLQRITHRQLARFFRFYRDYQDVVLEYDADAPDRESAALADALGYFTNPEVPDIYNFSIQGISDYGGDELDSCDLCGNQFDVTELTHVRTLGDGVFLCPACVGRAEFRGMV